MATVKEIVERAYAKVNGEAEAVAESSDDFRTYLTFLNETMEDWATTPNVKWQSLYDSNHLLQDKVAANKLVYDIVDADRIVVANTAFDSIYFMSDQGVLVGTYKMTDQALFESTNNTNVCAIFSDGLHLKKVATELIGTNIRLPAYVLPPKYTAAAQTVRVDNANWLVAQMAASICDASPVPFIARNADKFYKQAAEKMKTMKRNNRHSQHLTIKKPGQTIGDERYTTLSQAINAGVGAGGGLADSIDGGTF